MILLAKVFVFSFLLIILIEAVIKGMKMPRVHRDDLAFCHRCGMHFRPEHLAQHLLSCR